MYVCIYIYIYMYMYMSLCLSVCVCACVVISVCLCVFVCVCVCVHCGCVSVLATMCSFTALSLSMLCRNRQMKPFGKARNLCRNITGTRTQDSNLCGNLTEKRSAVAKLTTCSGNISSTSSMLNNLSLSRLGTTGQKACTRGYTPKP